MHDLPEADLALVNVLPRVNEWVFANGRSTTATYRTARHHFSEIVAGADLEDVRLHDLRRTLITVATASGESAEKVLAESVKRFDPPLD